MGLEKIQFTAPKLSELVMDSILTAIEKGDIKLGEDLPPERDLAVTLGVGRGSLRECLAILEFMGVIESRGNRKVVMKTGDHIQKAISFLKLSFQKDTVPDFIEFRRVNEVAIGRLACVRATEEDLQLLKDAVDRLERDPSDYLADVEFHKVLAQSCHNTMFIATINLVNSMIIDLRTRYFQYPDYHQKTLDSHRCIYEAIRDKDQDRTEREIEQHLSNIEAFAARGS